MKRNMNRTFKKKINIIERNFLIFIDLASVLTKSADWQENLKGLLRFRDTIFFVQSKLVYE